MKGKVLTGKSAAGLHRYLMKPDAEILAGSCEPQDYLRVVAALRATRPDVKKAALHFSISHDPDDPRKMTEEDWRRAIEILRERMSMQELEYLAIRHNDTEHDHIHIEACKIAPDGTVWNDSHSARRLHRACERIEKELGLQMTITVEQHRRQRQSDTTNKTLSDGAMRQFQRTGTVPNKTKEAIQRRIANERKTADRNAHHKAVGDNGKLATSSTANPRQDQLATTANRIISAASCEATAASQRAIEPPTLNNRLTATPAAPGDGWHLTWPMRSKPTFHVTSSSINLLARPDTLNTRALFDIAKEAQLGEPLEITGSPEFQLLAVREAARRGIEVKTENLHGEARQIAEAAQQDRAEKAFAEQHFARKEAEERQRELEKLRAQQAAEREREQQRQRSPGPAPKPPAPR